MLRKTKKVIYKFTKDFDLKRNRKHVIYYLFIYNYFLQKTRLKILFKESKKMQEIYNKLSILENKKFNIVNK